MKKLNLLLLCVIIYCVGAKENSEDNGFIFTAPKILRSGRRETVCLSLHGNHSTGQANITVNLEINGPQRLSATTKKVLDAENVGCFELRVPNTTIPVSTARLHLKVRFTEQNYSINSVATVNIVQSIGITFVQTDKEIYKPGDRVKIRILILSQDLTVPKNLVIPLVKIRNPTRIAIGQWENVTTELGIVQLEHQLAQETMLGTWTIELPDNNESFKNFEVKEYVLPRYEVNIQHPESVYFNAKSFNFSVCAIYSYGSSVKGTAHMKIHLLSRDFTVNQIKELKNGCSDFVFDRSEIPIKEYKTLPFQLIATVTEQGSGQIETTASTVKISFEKYTLEFVNMSRYFQTGIPYHGQIKVSERFTDLTNKTMKICYNLSIKESWNMTDEQCGQFKIEENHLVPFVIFPFDDDIQIIKLTATIEELDSNIIHRNRQYVLYHNVLQWYSPSNSFIQVSHDVSNIPFKCKSWQKFTVLYTLNQTLMNKTKDNEPIVFQYLIKSKGHIFKFGKMAHVPNYEQQFNSNEYRNALGEKNMKPKLTIDKFILTLKIHQRMFLEGQLIVYYVRPDGEVVGTSINFDVEKCLSNKVEASWSDKQNYPGETTNLKIKAAAGSLCAISAIDKSASLLGPVLNLDVDTLLNTIPRPRFYDYISNSQCSKSDSSVANDNIEDMVPYWDLRRRKRFFENPSTLYDTQQVFNDVEMLVMTDLKIVTRPCSKTFLPVHFRLHDSSNMIFANEEFKSSGALYQTQNTDKGASIRSHFPETWLWELVAIGRSGEIQLEKQLPHSITQWIGNTVCISPSAGIGISKTNHITTFKPFFIDLLTPYSIKRNEVSHLKVIIFNYLNHSLPVRITLDPNTGLRLPGPPEEASVTACIGPNESITKIFRVSALTLGKVNVTITAEVDSAYPGECGPEILLDRRDVIVKTIYVQPEGFPLEVTKSAFICVNENFNNTENEIEWNMELPYDTVKNSSRIKILLDADFLELSIQHLGELLHIPTGCGEQIIATLTPNLYVLEYLNSTGNLTPDIHQKALKNIKIGYERILQYKHYDGSFSAFGEKHGNGSMFLTAFVARTLAQASKYVYIEKNVIRNAVLWIIEQQLENGCFPAVSHDFQPSITEHGESNSGLTAYVLISLLESGLPILDTVRNNAKFCLRGYNGMDKYTMAIITHALMLVEWKTEANRSLERLLELASRENNLIWWEDTESLSSSIEMTSYMIMSLIKTNTSENMALASSAVRWILMKRNAYGGFVSTQDTVVALNALTKYAFVAKSKEINLSIAITTANKQHNFRIKNKAKLKTKQITLSKFSDFVKFKIDGSGCILLQSVLRYNMPQILNSEAFKLAVAVSSVSTIDKCAIAEIIPCLSYIATDKLQTNMAVLEVTLPSGYRADRASLHDLLKNTRVKRFEEVENKVIFYFTKLDNERVCVPFFINEQSIVENRAEAIIRLYDYYNPDISASINYEMIKCLSNDIEKIPHLSQTDSLGNNENNTTLSNTTENDNLKDLSGYQQDTAYDGENANQITDDSSNLQQTNLNPDFVDLDIELDFPSGVEGPEPVYVKPPPEMNKKT